MKKNNDELIKDTNRKIKAYQRLSLYSAIPGVLDFVSLIIALLSQKPMLLLSTGVTRFAHVSFDSLNAGYAAIFVSIALAAIFCLMAYFSIKGKLFGVLVSGSLYLADTVFLFLAFFLKLGGEDIFLNNFVFMAIIHGLFLTIFILSIVFYVLATKALAREKKASSK